MACMLLTYPLYTLFSSLYGSLTCILSPCLAPSCISCYYSSHQQQHNQGVSVVPPLVPVASPSHIPLVVPYYYQAPMSRTRAPASFPLFHHRHHHRHQRPPSWATRTRPLSPRPPVLQTQRLLPPPFLLHHHAFSTSSTTTLPPSFGPQDSFHDDLLHRGLRSPDILLDTRPASSFLYHHLQGSTWLPLPELLSRLYELPPPYEAPVVVVAEDEDKAREAGRILQAAG